MRHIHHKSSKPAAAVMVLVLASLALAACGSSSNSSSTSKSSSTSTTSTAGGSAGASASKAIAGRFTAARECLEKNGVKLPRRTPGQPPQPGAGGLLGGAGAGAGGASLPTGMTRAQYEALLQKCGAGFLRGGFRHRLNGIGSRLHSPAITKALTKFATCMRENGVPVPAPNTSGKGPIFNTKGLNVQSATFKAAETKCRSSLSSAFRASPGTAGAAG